MEKVFKSLVGCKSSTVPLTDVYKGTWEGGFFVVDEKGARIQLFAGCEYTHSELTITRGSNVYIATLKASRGRALGTIQYITSQALIIKKVNDNVPVCDLL